MQFMIQYKFGEIVLVLFLQSDGERKKRPALVILDTGDDDIVLAPITTKERKGVGDYKISNWQEGGLLLGSWVRLTKIACIEKNNVERLFGKITLFDKRKIISILKQTYKL
jgi:mRNA interferase MazF